MPVIAQSHSGCASRVREGRLWHDATYVAVCHGRGPSASAASRRAPGSISAMRDRCTTLAGQMRVHAGARRSTATKNDCMRAIVDRWRQEAKHKNRACGDDDVRLLSRRSRDGHRPEAGAHRGTAIRKRASEVSASERVRDEGSIVCGHVFSCEPPCPRCDHDACACIANRVLRDERAEETESERRASASEVMRGTRPHPRDHHV